MRRQLKRVLPWQAVAVLRALRPRTWRDARPLAPVWSYVRLLHVYETASSTPPGDPVWLTIRPLGSARIGIRPGTTDARVLFEVLTKGLHLPPAGIDPRVICDLGANAGFTTADLLMRYERARVVGVEPQPETAALARRNIDRWRDRGEIVEAAVWSADGPLELLAEAGDEWGARVVSTAQAGRRAVQGLSLNTLLADEDEVDFVKMDVEGAEKEVLTTNAEWAAKVRCLKVEVHAPWTVDECQDALSELGFETQLGPWHSILAQRR